MILLLTFGAFLFCFNLHSYKYVFIWSSTIVREALGLKFLPFLNIFRISGSGVKEFCSHSTKVECMKFNESHDLCEKLHFAKILQPHTDESLGDCSFLNTCFHMDTCKYIHYEVDAEDIRKQRLSSSHVYTNFKFTIFFCFIHDLEVFYWFHNWQMKMPK